MHDMRKLNPKLRAESIICAAHIENISFHKLLKGMTPYEAWFGEKLDASNFRIFGTKT